MTDAASGLQVRLRRVRGNFALDAAFGVPPHGITALFGASGAGKTSCLRAIAGLDRDVEGRVDFGGNVWQDSASRRFVPPHRRGIGYVFQETSLFPHLSVAGNLDYGQRRSPRRRAVDRRYLVEQFGVDRLLARKPNDLSGGERQRVALVRALLADPVLLLLDEPLSALDASAREELLDCLEQRHAELAVPTIYVSHALDEVLRLASHMVVMNGGRVVAQGSLPSALPGDGLLPVAAGPLGGAIEGYVGQDRRAGCLERADGGRDGAPPSRCPPTSRLLTVADADRLIRAAMPAFGSERVALEAAAGRVLRQSVRAERDQPPFDRVMMDGIAVAIGDGSRRRFERSGLQLAGMAQQSLNDSTACMEVATGAMLPRGCDTVIPVEQIRHDGKYCVLAEGHVPAPGQFVHPRGSDCRRDAPLLEPGMRLDGPSIAVLAANGIAEVEVATVPSVTIVATGDELAGVGQPLLEGQIRGSNDHALAATLRSHGFDDVQLARVGDDLPATIAVLTELLRTRRVLVLSGGVSVGPRDVVPAALDALGVRQVLHGIAQRPGKPMWCGMGPQEQVVFALPGNPVSALVCAVRHVLPALQSAIGLVPAPPPQVCLESALDASAALTLFVPVRLRQDSLGRTMACPWPTGTSGDFSALPHTHGFVQIPSGQTIAPAGAMVAFHRW